MNPATLVAAALFAGVLAYAILGGADFGSGFYDLTAGRGPRAGQIRTLIDTSIGPVWEANHVWLIYVLVLWWTGFPRAFTAATTTLFTPFMLALAGIVLRGASFAFRKDAATFAQARLFGAAFAGSSLLTPFFLGTVVGALASGRVPADGYGDPVRSWLNPTSLAGGCLALTTSVFLAGVFLTADTAGGTADTALAQQLRVRTLAVGVLAGLLVFASLYPVLHDARTLRAGLLGRALPVLIVSAVSGALTLTALARASTLQRRGRLTVMRITAVLAVAAVIAGWGMAQYPWMLVDHLTITASAGAPATLHALLIVVVLAGLLVLPPLAFLLWFTHSQQPGSHRASTTSPLRADNPSGATRDDLGTDGAHSISGGAPYP